MPIDRLEGQKVVSEFEAHFLHRRSFESVIELFICYSNSRVWKTYQISLPSDLSNQG